MSIKGIALSAARADHRIAWSRRGSCGRFAAGIAAPRAGVR